jgi:lysophospholipase L1-like esterase
MLAVAASVHAMSAARVRVHTRVIATQPTTAAVCRIFAYGDSLTAGTYDMSEPEALCPYAPFLEHALGDRAMVRHRGLPGWTAQGMLDNQNDEMLGLCGLLRRIKKATDEDPPVSLAIILAGTNDLGCYASAESIADSVIGLHRAAHGLSVRTLAIGIPPSAFQARDALAATTAKDVNDRLREWCAAEPMAAYEAHPVGEFEPRGALWSADGLHLSPEGYRQTAEGLAPAVRRLLSW